MLCSASPCLPVQAAEEARSALSAEQAKTLKLETQLAELTDKLNSVQVGHERRQGAVDVLKRWQLSVSSQ